MADTTRGGLTDEGIAALRARIGIPTPHPQPPWYREPGTDAFWVARSAIDFWLKNGLDRVIGNASLAVGPAELASGV